MSTERFDTAAATWDTKPDRVKVARAIAEAIGAKLPLTKKMTGLEYGCGTGLVTLCVAEQVKAMYGVDSSGGMITALQAKIAEQGVANVSLFHGALTDLDLAPLDLVILSMVLHHIEDYQTLLAQCADLLKPGGFLVIADLETEDGSFHEDNQGIAHFGFKLQSLCQVVQDCGFTGVETQTVYTIAKKDRQYPVFMLTAVKVAESD